MVRLTDDLKSQREALTEDMDGSGGESEGGQGSAMEAGGECKPSKGKGSKFVLRDSYKACLMITVMLGGFATLALIALSVVRRAFDPDHIANAAIAFNASDGALS